MSLKEFVRRYPPESMEKWPPFFGEVLELRYPQGHINIRPDGWQAVRNGDIQGSLCIFRGMLGIVDWPWNWLRDPWKRCAKHLGLT